MRGWSVWIRDGAPGAEYRRCFSGTRAQAEREYLARADELREGAVQLVDGNGIAVRTEFPWDAAPVGVVMCRGCGEAVPCGCGPLVPRSVRLE